MVQSVLKERKALEVNLEEPHGYELRIVPIESTPNAGVKLIGETSVGWIKGLCALKCGNPLLPSVLRIKAIRFSHKTLMSFRRDKSLAGWVARNLYMHLRRKGAIDVWARDHSEAAHMNPRNAIQFTSRYNWFLKDAIRENAWSSRSRDALIELSSAIELNLFTAQYARLACLEVRQALLSPEEHFLQELETKIQISRNLATSIIWKGLK
ncbi:MAG: hypothetical protein KME02_16095 [Aphanothece saxicola GSE-SYN-MK-01-06B]|nr:hypothetical protein [Aphanothece saxicola GSE-SYN-MK-01-06B]